MRWESFDRDLEAVKRSLMRFSDKSLSVSAPHAQSSANLIKVCKLCVCVGNVQRWCTSTREIRLGSIRGKSLHLGNRHK